MLASPMPLLSNVDLEGRSRVQGFLPTRVLNIAKLGSKASQTEAHGICKGKKRAQGAATPGQNQKKKLDEKDTAKERYHLEPKPLTHRTSAEEVLQQTNALVLIVNHVRSRFGVNPCGGAIAKSNGICNGKYAEEVSPKIKITRLFLQGKNFLRKLLIINWKALESMG